MGREREIAEWVHHEGSVRRSITQRVSTLTTELHLAPKLLENISKSGERLDNPLSLSEWSFTIPENEKGVECIDK